MNCGLFLYHNRVIIFKNVFKWKNCKGKTTNANEVADAGVCCGVLGKQEQINPKFRLSSLICGLCDDYPLVSVPVGGGNAG